MNLQELLAIIQPVLGYPLNPVEQVPVINQTNGPLWVVAGPGSGKTEVLVVRTLKLVFVDGVNPKSIIITTFTNKAAKNLLDRILDYANYIFRTYPTLQTQIDMHSLRIGTLHSLCNDIMLEYRHREYENYRLLDDLEQYLFVYEQSNLVQDSSAHFLPLWQTFDYLVDFWDYVMSRAGWGDRTRPPNKWRKAKAAVALFNRIVEDMIDLNAMRNRGAVWTLLADAYDNYVTNLETHRRCDFAHLQSKFLGFLNSQLGTLFLDGDNSDRHPGITHVMVDEYQDTNPVQEAIYLKLAERSRNLCVVGDDDQALYRFRGGTVDCMVTFNRACEREWGISNQQVVRRFLSSNYRSHPDIVGHCNDYIRSFPVMRLGGARVYRKPRLRPRSSVSGAYPAVAFIAGRTIQDTANNFAQFVRDLLDNGIIQLPSQCALLMRSVRETPHNAGYFADALRQVGIQPYNPRSRTFLQQEEIMGALGAFISVVDPNVLSNPTSSALSSISGPGIQTMVANWAREYQSLSTAHQSLPNYVSQSLTHIARQPSNSWLGVNTLEIMYRILAHEPFTTWQNDPERSYRLGKLTKIFEAYSSVPYPGSPGSTRGNLRTSTVAQGEVSFRWRRSFYYSLVGLLVAEGMSDPEQEEIISPADRLPIMTVHQAKGLEFHFVFVYGLNRAANEDSSVRLEEALSQFRRNSPFLGFSRQQKTEQDLIRFYYVAYSRARYALILLVPRVHLRGSGFGFAAQDLSIFQQTIAAI